MLTIRESGMTIAWLICSAAMASGQTPITVVTFDVTNGLLPYFGDLVQAGNGDLYGTTYEGGKTTCYGTPAAAWCTNWILPDMR